MLSTLSRNLIVALTAVTLAGCVVVPPPGPGGRYWAAGGCNPNRCWPGHWVYR